MQPLASDEIRSSFVNCSKGEAARLPLPRDLPDWPWDHVDFLGWRDQRTPQAAYLVAIGDGGPVGIVLRLSADRRSGGRQNMCSLCTTVHSAADVALMVARRAGASGRQGNTVGAYLCADLACSLMSAAVDNPSACNRSRPSPRPTGPNGWSPTSTRSSAGCCARRGPPRDGGRFTG